MGRKARKRGGRKVGREMWKREEKTGKKFGKAERKAWRKAWKSGKRAHLHSIGPRSQEGPFQVSIISHSKVLSWVPVRGGRGPSVLWASSRH